MVQFGLDLNLSWAERTGFLKNRPVFDRFFQPWPAGPVL